MLFQGFAGQLSAVQVVVGNWHGVHKPVELQVASIIQGMANQDLRLRTVLNWTVRDTIG